MKKEQGFTLLEMLVSLVVFVLIGGAAFNLLVAAIAGQRAALTNQTVVDQISSAAEYMSRAIRQAKKDIADLCLTSGTHVNYEVSGGGQTLRLLDKEGFCREFSFASGAIREQKSADGTAAGLAASPIVLLTSDDIVIQGLQFFIQGQAQPPADTLQPRVTFFIDAQGLELQTTVSQRKFDVQE